MSRIPRLVMMVVLLMAFLPQATVSAEDTDFVTTVTSSSAPAVSKETAKLLKVGSNLYFRKICGWSVTKNKCTHSTAYQRRAYKHLSAGHRKAVRVFLAQISITKYGSDAPNCNPRVQVCPLMKVDIGSVRPAPSLSASANVSCWTSTLFVSEGSNNYFTGWPWPIWIDWYKFQLQVNWCSDGTNITYVYFEPSSVWTEPAFWDTDDPTHIQSDPGIPTPDIDYYTQEKYILTPPIVGRIVIVTHRIPWIRVHIHATGTITAEEGVKS